MKIKVLTTNIWRYYEWEKRKDKWKNQVEEINEKTGYLSSNFGKLMEMKKWHDKSIDWVMFYGFGILSKYSIKHSEVIILPPVEKNKKFGFMHVVIETPKR